MDDKTQQFDAGVEAGAIEQPKESPSAIRKPARWKLFAWLAAGIGFVLLLVFDIPLMRLRYAVIGKKPEGFLDQVIIGLRDFAQVVPIVVTVILVATYDRRRWRIIPIMLFALLLVAITSNSAKWVVSRWRPQDAIEKVAPLSELTQSQTWIGWGTGNRETATQAFPSGHSAAAFALAGVLSVYYPPIRWLVWTLAVGCAVSRYLDAVHWPSDCLVGAVLGYVCAWIALLPARWGRGQDS